MKTTVRSIVTRAIALAFTFIAGTSLADTDELGLTPRHWYKFNGNFNSSGGTAVTISGENTSNFFDGVNDQAMKVVDGKTHPYGSGVQYGNGAWSIVTVGKAVLSESNATSFWTTGTKKGGWFGLLAKDGSTAVVAKGNGSGISETALTASGIDTTIYHCYAIVYDGSGGLSLYVDGTLVDSKTDFSPNTNGSFQWGAVNGGLPTGIKRVTDTGLDDWRLYQKALTAGEVKTITYAFVGKTTPRVIAVNFSSDDGKIGATSDTGIPYFPLPGSGWNNSTGASGSITAKAFDTETGSVVEGTSATISYSCGNTYSWTTATCGILKGYLDDSSIRISSTDIPFERYDLILITATNAENAKFQACTVNGTMYTTEDGVGKTGSSAWGVSRQMVPILGTNTMRIDGLTGELSIAAQNKSGSNRGCIAAIILVENNLTYAELTATISGEKSWSEIVWSGDDSADVLTYKLTLADDTTLVLDGSVDGSRYKIDGNNHALTIKNSQNLTSQFGMVNVSSITYEYDCTAGFNAPTSLLSQIKDAPTTMKFVFKGAGNYGATLSYGNTQTDTAISTHIVFDGGTHVWHKLCDSKGLTFGANATVDNPTMLVTNGATLNWEVKNPCGWGAGAANTAGILRINDGSKVIYKQVSGTAYWTQQIYIEPGAEFVINDSNASDQKFRIAGGTSESACQIYVPGRVSDDGKVAKITQSSTAGLWPKNEGTAGMAIYVGANSTLEFEAGVRNDRTVTKYGDGKIVVKGTGFTTPLAIAEGSLGLTDGSVIANLTINKATTIDVPSGSATISAFSGDYAITKTGDGMLNLPTSYTSAITLSGGLINHTATNTVTINGEIDLATTEMPLAWTLDSASTGTLTLPAGFPFGQIAKASAIPAELTVKDSDGKMVAVELDGEYLVLPKSEIIVPYNVNEQTIVDDLTFGDGGSINITHNGAMLIATGTIELPANGLPITFVCEDEYVVGTQVAVVKANNFLIGGSDATIADFNCSLTGKLPKGMAGEFQLVESDGKKAIVFEITKSEYYTDAVATILEGGNLLVRFEADRGIAKDENGNVIQWDDISGNNVSATPYAIGGQTVKPVFVSGDARDYVDFGAVGSGKDLQWARTGTIRTVVIAMDIEDNWCAFILGDTSGGSFHRAYSGTLGAYAASGEGLKYDTIRDNGAVVENFYNTKMPTGFRVTSITTTGNIGAARFTQDRAQGAGRTGGKKLCEVMLFDKVLTADELTAVEGYLTEKWNFALKNTATISGEKNNWSELDWTAGRFYADAPTEITLTDDAVLTYDAAAPIGNITFVKGDYELEQVVTSATGLVGAFAVPAGETVVFKGGETDANTFTYTGAIAVNGTLKTEGYVNLNANNTIPGGTLEVVNGQATLKFAGQGVNNGGTLTIDEGATVIAASGDALHYNGNVCTLNVYGTLNMGDYRWTIMNKAVFNLYAGANVTGSGDGNGALDMHVGLNAKAKEGESTVTVNAPFKFTDNVTFDVGDGVTLKLTAAVKSNLTKTLTKTGSGTLEINANQGNVTVALNEGILRLGVLTYVNGFSGAGTVELASGTHTIGAKRDFGSIALKTVDNTTLAFTSSLAEDGKFSFALAEGSVLPTVTLDGVTIENPSFTDNTITFSYTPSIKGEACWMDYEFDGDLGNVGSDKTGLARDQDGGKYIYGDPTTNDFRCVGKDADGNDVFDALYAGSHPYRSVTWPENFSCAMFGTLPEYSHSCLFAFGSTTEGTKGGIALMTGDVTKNEVLLVKWTGGSGDDAGTQKYETMATMSVPNAYTASHLYIFVKEGNTVKVYLDGMIWTTYTSTTDFKMGTGFQICSVHGGSFSTGINRFYPGVFDGFVAGDPSTYDSRSYTCVIEALRLYNGVIGENAINELKKEFKYVSPNGNAEREVATTDGTWVQDGAWTLTHGGEVSTAAQPLASSALTLVAEAANAALTINLEGAVSYEAVTISGTDNVEGETLTIKSGSGSVINAGQTTINVPLTIEAGAMTIFGGPTFIKGSGSVTFDYRNYSFKDAITGDAGFIQLTGILDASEKDLVTVELPESDKYFTLEAAYDTASTTYRINYTRKTTEVTIPEIAGTTVAVTGGTLVGATATVPYGATFTVIYTLEENFVFLDGTTEPKAFEFPNVTEAPTIDVSGIKTMKVSEDEPPVTGDVTVYKNETGTDLVLAATNEEGYTGDGVKLSEKISNYESVKNIVIGSGVKHIGNRYFKDFTGLTTVKGGKDLVKFDEKAFYRCMSLEKIELENPAALESLKDAVVYQMAINAKGEFFMIPSIQVSGYVEKLYGKQSLDTKVDDWTEIGLLSGQNLEELKAGGVYHFFQTRFEKTATAE